MDAFFSFLTAVTITAAAIFALITVISGMKDAAETRNQHTIALFHGINDMIRNQVPINTANTDDTLPSLQEQAEFIPPWARSGLGALENGPGIDPTDDLIPDWALQVPTARAQMVPDITEILDQIRGEGVLPTPEDQITAREWGMGDMGDGTGQ